MQKRDRQRRGKAQAGGKREPFAARAAGLLMLRFLDIILPNFAQNLIKFFTFHIENPRFKSSLRSAARRRLSVIVTAPGVMPQRAAMSATLSVRQ